MLENSYNNVFATWHLRAVDQYTIGDSASAVVNLIYQEKINPNLSYKVKFFFLEGDEANYSGMASVYRSYLIGKHDLKPSYKPREAVIQLHGGIQVKESFLGIPVRKTIALTTYEQAEMIISDLSGSGIARKTVVYYDWTSAGIRKRAALGKLASPKLGGTRGIESLTGYCREQDVRLFMDIDLLYFERGRIGASVRRNSALLLSGLPAVQREFLLSTSREADKSTRGYLSSAKLLARTAQSVSEQYRDIDAGLSAGSMGEYLYSDFGGNDPGREDMLRNYLSALDAFGDDGSSIVTSGGNIYMLGRTEVIMHSPDSISGFDIEDEAVPFYQIALSGLAEMTLGPVNRSSDPVKMVLQTIETGTSLYFSWFYNDPYILKNTRYNDLYGSDHSAWLEEASVYYQQVLDAENALGESFLQKHRRISDDVYESIFSNGFSVIVNYSDEPYEDQQGIVQGRSFAVRDSGGKTNEDE